MSPKLSLAFLALLGEANIVVVSVKIAKAIEHKLFLFYSLMIPVYQLQDQIIFDFKKIFI